MYLFCPHLLTCSACRYKHQWCQLFSLHDSLLLHTTLYPQIYCIAHFLIVNNLVFQHYNFHIFQSTFSLIYTDEFPVFDHVKFVVYLFPSIFYSNDCKCSVTYRVSNRLFFIPPSLILYLLVIVSQFFLHFRAGILSLFLWKFPITHLLLFMTPSLIILWLWCLYQISTKISRYWLVDLLFHCFLFSLLYSSLHHWLFYRNFHLESSKSRIKSYTGGLGMATSLMWSDTEQSLGLDLFCNLVFGYILFTG